MENERILNIKEQRRKFCMLRKEVIRESCMEIKKQITEREMHLNKFPNDKCIVRNPSVRILVLDYLKSFGYDLNDKGTEYLATLITIFFHERKLYQQKNIDDKSYWNLKDFSNEHYQMLGDNPDNVIKQISNSINKNEYEDGSIAEVVYTLADIVGVYGKDRKDKERVPYSRMLIR